MVRTSHGSDDNVEIAVMSPIWGHERATGGRPRCILIQKYFCAIYDYAGKADLSKGY